jgi:hypothetical protein
MKIVDVLKFLMTTKKRVLANLLDAELQDKNIYLAYNGERVVLYSNNEDNHTTIFYAVPADPAQFEKLIDCQEPLTTKFSKHITISQAAEIVKMTWRKRYLPPKIESPIMFFFILAGAIGLVELVTTGVILLRTFLYER